ncbi:hypothetical protein OGAPHI_005555 [Ogataea philodendri]|uniref:Uncharacterized protein n=1 Tax=Ogataea philodendri TaxID=1378263 RepID=A0A9P8NZE7_9ASCO|nr:uncharacterized protein OGAPHI_005555 [Ogataea philodendri]KAH3662305.1 hypothetical protein OGAPHI_005555 [Ogataea philodendri]
MAAAAPDPPTVKPVSPPSSPPEDPSEPGNMPLKNPPTLSARLPAKSFAASNCDCVKVAASSTLYAT